VIRDPERRPARDAGNDQPGREGHLRMLRIGTGIRGGCLPFVAMRSRRHAGCQSQEGMSRREAWAIAVRSSSEGRKPRERAGLKHTREIIAGGRRRSRQERQGRNVTRAGKAREWWLAMLGCAEGAKNLERAEAAALCRLRGTRVKL
jgi:hypothetical protein